MTRSRWLTLILLPLLAVFAAGPRAAAAKDELVIGLTQFPSNFHPNIDSMAAKSYVLAMTRRPFTTYDKDWKLICMLCTELPSIEKGTAKIFDMPDGTKGIATTYTIQPNATWGDGTPVTTDDVMFTWEVGRNEQSSTGNLELYRRILKVDVHDKKTFTFHVSKLSFEYAGINDFGILPAHIERQNFTDPANYRRRTGYDTDTTNPGLYFGPYRIAQVVPGSHVVLEPNPTWYGEKPYFKRITVRTIENTAALEANILSGAIDYIAGELGVSLDQALAFEKRHRDRFNVIYKPGLIYEHIDFNLDNPILQDKRVRHALIYALDREAMSRQLFEGKQPVVNSFVSPLDWMVASDIPTYKYDPKKASDLLDEAGWKVIVSSGERINTATGQQLTLELMTTAGNRTRETVQQVLQSQWRKLGIDVRLRNEPARVFFGETMRKRQYPALAMYAWISSPENVPRSTLRSDEIPIAEKGFSGQNTPGFRNAEMDKLIDEIELELDKEKRRVMWHRIQEIYAEELPVLPLYSRADPFIIPKWLTGIEPTGHQYPSTLWVETWRSQ
jgi:peptide/nickel transport system substrate-binding protein